MTKKQSTYILYVSTAVSQWLQGLHKICDMKTEFVKCSNTITKEGISGLSKLCDKDSLCGYSIVWTSNGLGSKKRPWQFATQTSPIFKRTIAFLFLFVSIQLPILSGPHSGRPFWNLPRLQLPSLLTGANSWIMMSSKGVMYVHKEDPPIGVFTTSELYKSFDFSNVFAEWRATEVHR